MGLWQVPGGDSMPFRIEKDGFSITVSTQRELQDVIKALQDNTAKSKSSRGPGRPRTRDIAGERSQKQQALRDRVITFLQLLASRQEVELSEVVAHLELVSEQAVGPLLAAVNRFLIKIALPSAEVYTSKKLPNQPKIWERGKKLTKAISKIEELQL